MGDRTLNISEPQVLVHFPNDGHGFYYHHRILLHKVSGGRWVTLTPDLDQEIHDLNNQRHVVLGRNSLFPVHLAQECYVFDEITKNELERQKKIAKTTASILDDSAVVDIAALQWYVADPSSEKFGLVVPSELLDDLVTLGSCGLVQWDQEIEFARELGADEVKAFKEERKDASSDLRTIGDHRDAQGRRFLSFADAIVLLRESKFEDWGFSGPRAVLEFVKAVQAGPGDLSTYHLAWTRSSGVAPQSAIVHEHRCLCEALRLGLTRDLLDISNLMVFEHLTRRLLTLEIAVSRNPQMPDFGGLDVVSEAPISSQGSAHVASMSSWITEKLKERANIQKQSRLFREEFGRTKGAGKGGKEEGDPENPKARWKKKKKGGQDGGGAAGSAGGQWNIWLKSARVLCLGSCTSRFSQRQILCICVWVFSNTAVLWDEWSSQTRRYLSTAAWSITWSGFQWWCWQSTAGLLDRTSTEQARFARPYEFTILFNFALTPPTHGCSRTGGWSCGWVITSSWLLPWWSWTWGGAPGHGGR